MRGAICRGVGVLLLIGSTACGGTSSPVPGSPTDDNGDDDDDKKVNEACPATHAEVYDVCKGCNPMQENLYNSLYATEFNKQIRSVTERCAQGALSSNFLGSKVLDADIKGCIKQSVKLSDRGEQKLMEIVTTAQSAASKEEVDSWLMCRQGVRTCGKSSCESTPALPPPAECSKFEGRWHRWDKSVLEMRMSQDCEVTAIWTPTHDFVQELRARAVGNELVGVMRRRNVHDGCEVLLHTRLRLEGDRLEQSVDRVEGQCDIGPGYTEKYWLTREPGA